MARLCMLLGIGVASILFSGIVPIASTAPSEMHALVEMSEHCLIGGVQNQKWISADRFLKTLKSADGFEFYSLQGGCRRDRAEKECRKRVPRIVDRKNCF